MGAVVERTDGDLPLNDLEERFRALAVVLGVGQAGKLAAAPAPPAEVEEELPPFTANAHLSDFSPVAGRHRV